MRSMKMQEGKPSILIIGALPPPAIGPYLATERLLASPLLNQAFRIEFLDISDRRPPTNLGRLDWVNLLLGVRHAFQCLRRLLFLHPAIVYVAISQNTWGYLRDLAFVLPALCLRRHVVLHLRGSEFRTFLDGMSPLLRWLTERMLSRCACVIVLGDKLRGVFAGLVDPDRIVAIPNGIDYRRFARDHAEHASPPAGSRILYLSSLRKRKGLFLLLEALPEVFAHHSDAVVTVAGLWQDDTEETEARALIRRLGLEEKLRFVGEVSGADKVQAFHEHDVFVFTPIEPEGLPWVILEAMSAALPVVTTDQGAIAEVVESGVTGLIVPPTVDAVARGMCELLDHPELARAMGARGRERVALRFSEETYVSRLVAVFRQVLSGGSPAAGIDPKGREWDGVKIRLAKTKV